MKYVIATLGVLLVVGIFLLMGWVGFSNDANAYETDIKSVYANNKNVYDNGWKKVMEVAQVPDMYKNDMKEVWQAALSGRYGNKGSQAVLQFIQEQNPQIDSELYKKVQRTVESFRDEFSSNQTRLASKKQEYGRFLYSNTSSRFYNSLTGGSYPHIKCGDQCGQAEDQYAILTSDKTELEFKDGKAEALTLRK